MHYTYLSVNQRRLSLHFAKKWSPTLRLSNSVSFICKFPGFNLTDCYFPAYPKESKQMNSITHGPEYT